MCTPAREKATQMKKKFKGYVEMKRQEKRNCSLLLGLLVFVVFIVVFTLIVAVALAGFVRDEGLRALPSSDLGPQTVPSHTSSRISDSDAVGKAVHVRL